MEYTPKHKERGNCPSQKIENRSYNPILARIFLGK
jgi:hypothetical protein